MTTNHYMITRPVKQKILKSSEDLVNLDQPGQAIRGYIIMTTRKPIVRSFLVLISKYPCHSFLLFITLLQTELLRRLRLQIGVTPWNTNINTTSQRQYRDWSSPHSTPISPVSPRLLFKYFKYFFSLRQIFLYLAAAKVTIVTRSQKYE